MRADRIAARRAFTLVELIFALTLGAGLCLGARVLLDALGRAREVLAHEAARSDRAANGERLLRSLVANIRADTGSVSHFEGDRRSARFASWCTVPSGWLERCVVCVSVRASGGDATVVMSPDNGGSFSVLNWRGSPELRYLDASNGDSRWIDRWSSRSTVPAAVGVVGDGDTLALVVGAHD
jgi:hypothetical protein